MFKFKNCIVAITTPQVFHFSRDGTRPNWGVVSVAQSTMKATISTTGSCLLTIATHISSRPFWSIPPSASQPSSLAILATNGCYNTLVVQWRGNQYEPNTRSTQHSGMHPPEHGPPCGRARAARAAVRPFGSPTQKQYYCTGMQTWPD